MLRKEPNKKRYRRPWKKLFMIMTAFIMMLSVLGSASLRAKEETSDTAHDWLRIVHEKAQSRALTEMIETPVVISKLIEGREVQEDDVFTFSVEPISENAIRYAEQGLLIYEEIFQVGPSVQPCKALIEKMVEMYLEEMFADAEGSGTKPTEEEIEIMRQQLIVAGYRYIDMAMAELKKIDNLSYDSLGMTFISVYPSEDSNHRLEPGEYTFRIKETGSNGELVDSKAEWELKIDVKKSSIEYVGKQSVSLTRMYDDAGNDDGQISGMIKPIVSQRIEPAPIPVASFTNTKLEGEVLLQPADMTIYMGGSEGYEGVVNNETNGTIESANSLPEAGYYLTLPEEADAMMKEAWRNSGDITEVTNVDGTTGYVLNLSDYVRIKDTEDGREWTLEMYGSGYSMAYNKYIYRLAPVDAAEPVRLQFTDPKGNTVTEDTFAIEDALYEEYTMEVYPQSVHAGNVVAEVKLSETKTLTFPVALEEGKLKVRYVSGEQSEVVHEAVEDIEQVVGEGGKLSDAAAVVKPGTKFYINDSQIPVGEDAKPSLLFDDLVTNEDAAGTDYEALLREAALGKTTAEYEDPRHEAKYLDLVDANNGNVWLQASEAVTVYWPYPEGTDEDTGFTLIHFKGLDREMGTEEAGDLIAQAKTEEIAVQKDERGIYFETKGFSPFVLLWEAEETEEPIVPSEPEETKKPSRPENDAIETGIASEGRIYGGMTASAALLAAIVYVLKKRQTPESK